MVLISWRAMRAIRTLMILVCVSESSLANTTLVTELTMVTLTTVEDESIITTAGSTMAAPTTAATTMTAPTTDAKTTAAITTLPPPDPPVNVTATAINATSFNVTWTHTGDTETEFAVTFRSYGGSDSGVLNNVTSGVEVTGRISGEEYTVAVISRLNDREARSSNTSVRLPPKSVVNLTEVDVFPDSSYIEVQWYQPCCNVTGYEIDCSSGDPSSGSLVEDGSENIATCINITAGDNITVTVTSIIVTDDNDTVRGADEQVIVTAYPNIVKNLSVLSRTSSNVSVQWDNPGGVVEKYKISCSGTATASPTSIPGNATLLKATCSDVPAGGEVKVTVSTTSGKKENPESITVEALPGEVLSLKESSATNNSVTVIWTLPADDVNRTYQYEADSSEDNVECSVLESNTEAECTNVTPGRLIYVTVTTVNGNLNNSASTPAQALPLAVSSFTEGDLTARSVSFSWEEVGGDVDQYNVSCSHGTANPDVVLEESTSLGSACEDLEGGETVNVTITTVTGDKSTSAIFDLTARPNRVVNLTEAAEGTDYIEAVWQKPGGIVTEYQIRCEDGGDADPASVVEDGSGLYRASCQNLPTPGANYTITVTPFSSDVSGENATIPITAEPAAPELLDDSSTVDSVSVSFNKSKGMVDYYRVECGNGVPEESTIPDVGDSEEVLTATCNVSTPGDTYDISITAVSNEKFSEMSTRNVTALPESVILESGNPTVDSVQASWPNPRGIVERFEVNCSPSGSAFAEDPFIESDSSIDIYTAKCNVSIPGYLYTLEVISDSSGEKSKAASEKLRALPNNVGDLRGNSSTTSVTVTWDEPVGVVDSYDVTIFDDDDLRRSDKVEEPIAKFDKLTPGTNYTVTVCSRSGNQSCTDNATTNVRTVPTRPSPPRDVTASDPQLHSVTISFRNPKKPNGKIETYEIYYEGKRGERTTTETSKPVPAKDDEAENEKYTQTIGDLLAGYTYTFYVVAQSDHKEPSERSNTTTAKTTQKEPEFTTGQDTLSLNVPGLHEIKLFINHRAFNHCNGDIHSYTVLVDGVQKIATQPFTNEPLYYDCHNGTSRKRRNEYSQYDIIVTIGDGSMSDDDHPNDRLSRKTRYAIQVRAINDAGFVDSEAILISTEKVNPAAYLVPIFVLLLILVLVAFIIWKERKDPGSIRNKFANRNGVDNPGFITDKPMRRTGNSRPVKLSGFALHLEEMSRDSDYLFSEEYNDLRPIGKNQADDAAKLDCNKVKNRFSNILPYDHTRVKLMPNDDEPGSDFINANYMIGHKSNREYIACQGPLQNTEEDMWRMVWEQGASLIVMVTQLMEGNKIKCHQYWPQDGEGPVRYGDIVVLARGTEHNELWVKRLFTLTKGPATREVVHYNFTAWPDHGVPDSPDHLIKFVKAVRESKKYDGKPVVVHCSAGVGRTGTFISLDTLMSQMESSDEVDIFGLVRRMRMNRCLMVQTEIQYIYIHQCVMALLEGTTENTYENYNGNEDPYYNEALI